MLTLTEITSQLISNKHIVGKDDKFVFTPKFYKDLVAEQKKVNFNAPKEEEQTVEVGIQLYDQYPMPAKLNTYLYQDWVEFYSRFIADAKVPDYVEIKYGNRYATNKYSEAGMKAFQRAIKSGCNYKALVVAVGMYYKSNTQYKKAVGSYMESGEWRTDYAKLLDEVSKGNIENYLTNDTNTTGSFTLG